jgi:hypothetical protein
MGLLLYNARRFAAWLSRIVQKADEQPALIDHPTPAGQEVTEADRQGLFAYLDVAHIASEALSHGVLVASSDDASRSRPRDKRCSKITSSSFVVENVRRGAAAAIRGWAASDMEAARHSR